MEALVRSMQDEICEAICAVERAAAAAGCAASDAAAAAALAPAAAAEGPGSAALPPCFHEDVWARAEGGGGRSRVLQGGSVFEKAGVNVSSVHGLLPPSAVAQMRSRPGKAEALRVEGGSSGGGSSSQLPFFACGISLVLHPSNPLAPTVHANYRFFRVRVPCSASPGGFRDVYWYGGGADLTPSYLFPEDAAHFHSVLRASCDRLHPSAYARFKSWADSYFCLPHRGSERRGLGGIFFDDLELANIASLTEQDASAPPQPAGAQPASASASASGARQLLPFVADCGRSFLHAYLPVLLARQGMPFSAEQRQWQQLRRGRYVEFNLVHDRGTKFGLATPGARIESILMSLPLTARWQYSHSPALGSAEAALAAVLKRPQEWV
jgi:coproporphyrinogen III oxidase